MKKELIVTAHDVGLCHSVNLGIQYALKHPDNIFTELSLLPNAPGSKEAGNLFRDADISINLCITLTNYRPLLKTHKTLVDANGYFKKADVSTWDFSAIDSYNETEIRSEIDAQWDWFIENVGRKPSALVTQKGEHGDPKILFPFIEKAKKEDVPIRSPYWKWQSNYAAQAYVAEEGLRCTNNMIIGCADWKGKYGKDLERDIEDIIELIETKDGITELFIFCGFVDAELFNLSTVSWQRGQYLHILKYRAEILRKLKERFELVDYSYL